MIEKASTMTAEPNQRNVNGQNKNEESSTQNPEEKLSFEWSFKPFQVLIKILTGVDLTITKTSAKNCWFSSIGPFYAFLMLILNLIVNVMWDVELIQAISQQPSNFDKASNDTVDISSDASFTPLGIIEYLNSNIYYLGVHLAFLLTTCCNKSKQSSWGCLWTQIDRIQKECQLLNVCDQCRKSRKIVILALIYVIVV